MSSHGLIGFDMSRLYPIDDGLWGNPAVLARLGNGEYIHGDDLLFRFYKNYRKYRFYRYYKKCRLSNKKMEEISGNVALRCSKYCFDHSKVRFTANSKFALWVISVFPLSIWREGWR
jgi:hypothetical protein